MKGDFSRDSHDRAKGFSRVLMQQGRVVLDADFNEQVSIEADRFRELARHLVGPGAGPAGDCGFEIVDDVTALEEDTAGPGDEERAALARGDLLVMPGTYYVEGLPVRLGERVLYSSQPGFPFYEDEQLPGAIDPGTDWIAYLEAWEEFVAPAEDTALLEPALGGPDTSGRAVVSWEVRVVPATAAGDPGMAASRERGRMRASTSPGEPGGYLGPGNHLYRVEVHSGSGSPGKPATFKWSRDNGSRLFPVSRLDRDTVVLADALQLELDCPLAGEWVELSLSDRPGRETLNRMGRIQRSEPAERTLAIEWATPGAQGDGESMTGDRWFLRKWDHAGHVEHGGAVPVPEGEQVPLENGIVVEFEPGGQYRRGDYWLVPARTSPSGIAWPGYAGGERPGFLPPRGPDRFTTPLATRRQGKLRDLRQQFHPIRRPVDPA